MENVYVELPVKVPEYLQDEEIISEPVELIPNVDDEVRITSEYDYSDYLETIIANQEIITSNQEIIIDSNAQILNAALGCDNVLVLTIIVFSGFWLVKAVFMKFF